jgi:hypothetical protein
MSIPYIITCDGNKTAEEPTAKELFLVTNCTQKNFWNTVK